MHGGLWGATRTYKEMQKVVLKCLNNMIRKDRKIQLVGDFNCKNVSWEEM